MCDLGQRPPGGPARSVVLTANAENHPLAPPLPSLPAPHRSPLSSLPSLPPVGPASCQTGPARPAATARRRSPPPRGGRCRTRRTAAAVRRSPRPGCRTGCTTDPGRRTPGHHRTGFRSPGLCTACSCTRPAWSGSRTGVAPDQTAPAARLRVWHMCMAGGWVRVGS